MAWKLSIAILLLFVAAAVFQWRHGAAASRLLEGPVTVGSVTVAEFDEDGDLRRPVEIENWVFLGASLGMGYNGQVPFDPDTPGNFQTVLMEPTAYQVFQQSGTFPDGSMFALLFHGTRTNVSINTSGFVMGEPLALEIHLKDKKRFPQTGFNFFFFDNDDTESSAMRVPNDCTSCHVRHAETDGVFTQFYPTLRPYLRGTD